MLDRWNHRAWFSAGPMMNSAIPSIAICKDDGRREGLKPSYALNRSAIKAYIPVRFFSFFTRCF